MKTINLTRAGSARNPTQQHAWLLRVTATGVEGAPSEVFVYSAGGLSGDVFQCVASTVQLDELGLRPRHVDGESQIPFYRTNVAEFLCRSDVEAARVWDVIQTDVQGLLKNLNAQDTLVDTAAVAVTAEQITTITP